MPTVSLSELLNSTNQLGYTGSRGNLDGATDQAILISNATPSSSSSTGALQVSGGAGISGNVYVGQELYVTGAILPTSNNTVNIGSPTQRFGTVYLSANSIDIGGAVISTTEQGSVLMETTTGNIDLNANAVSFLSNVAQGTAGQTGYTGSRGTDGVIGVDGYTGSAGFTGSAGADGIAGFTGSAGDAGVNGYTGSAGDAGASGYTGSGGTVSVTTGNTVPASPAAGDMWYRTTNNVLYQYTDVGTASYWIDISGPSYNFGISQSIQTAIAESTGVTPSLEYLVVAGGGGGSSSASVVGTGGGGAGGYLAGTWSVEAGTTYIITVGAGGAQAPGGTDQGNSGTGSSFGDVAVTYGGGRGGFWQGTAANGGSGGGGGGGTDGTGPIIPGRGVYPGSTYVSAARQGYDGGIGTGQIGSSFASGGGGGGAGGAGGNSASTTVQAAGGLGVYNTITGANVYYAKGGTGGVSSAGSAAPSYLAGGANTGSGGSGGSAHAGQTPGLAGGSGLVVFRYPSSYGDFLSVTGSPTVTNAGGYKVYVFTSSGSITI